MGSAFYSDIASASWTLPSTASIYTAELYAIWQALLFATFNDKRTTVICSDSLSAVLAIKNKFSSDPLIQRILTLIDCLRRNNKVVILTWLPGHIGIPGNELADRIARNATNETSQNILIRFQDIKSENIQKHYSTWRDQWIFHGNCLKIIKPNIEAWKFPSTLSRREQAVITRLRIGHTHLTSLYMLLGQRRPFCEYCPDHNLTVRHILLDCPQYARLRQNHGLSGDLKVILGNSQTGIDKTLGYLKDIGLFKKI